VNDITVLLKMVNQVSVIKNPNLFVLKVFSLLSKALGNDEVNVNDLLRAVKKYQDNFHVIHFHVVDDDGILRSEDFDAIINTVEVLGGIDLASPGTVKLNNCGKLFADSFQLPGDEEELIMSKILPSN
jgi:hypothetical protein